jgi:hypothetical protein
MCEPTDVKKKVIDTVAYLRRYSAGVRAVQAEFAKISGQGVGLCHDMAVAIIDELVKQSGADGWKWCSGKVDDGVEHSWVEYGGYRIDMNDRGILRYTLPGDDGAFAVLGEVTRRNAAETMAWVAEHEKLQAKRAGNQLPQAARPRRKNKKRK